MTIHREGRTILVSFLTFLLLLNILLRYFFDWNAVLFNLIAAVSVILFLLVLQFFRNPSVSIKSDARFVLAPADGKVVTIEEIEEAEFLGERRKQISIFMSPLNVHVNRMPVGGTISYFKYHPGKYLVAWHPKSSTENERTTVVVKTPSGVSVLFRQIAGAVARRIKWYVKEGDTLEQGQEFGFIKFGSRVDIFVPLEARVTVRVGDKTRAGTTIIAELT